MKVLTAALCAAVYSCSAADITGNWIAQVTGAGDPQYFRTVLQAEGPAGGGTSKKITGTLSEWKVEGTADGNSSSSLCSSRPASRRVP